MQANDLVRSLGRRAWILAVVALLAAGVGFAAAMRQAADTEVTAVVIIHPETSQFGSSVGYVTAFQAALDSSEVLDSVSSETGISKTDLSRGLQAQPTASNSLSFDVTYRGSEDKDVVAQVPTAAATGAITALYQPQLETARQEMEAAQAAVDETTAQVEDAQSATGVSPTAAYASLTNQITQLRVSLLQNQASSAPQYNEDALKAVINAAVVRARSLAGPAAEYTRLSAELDRRQGLLEQATSEVERLERASSPDTIASGILAGSTATVSRVSSAVQAAVAAGLVALVFGLLVLAAVSGRSRRTVRDEGAYVRPGLSTGK